MIDVLSYTALLGVILLYEYALYTSAVLAYSFYAMERDEMDVSFLRKHYLTISQFKSDS